VGVALIMASPYGHRLRPARVDRPIEAESLILIVPIPAFASELIVRENVRAQLRVLVKRIATAAARTSHATL
jgi:hypothetical protein